MVIRFKRKTAKNRNLISNIIDIHEKYKNSFFWDSPAHASSRRNAEFNEEYSIITVGGTIEVRQKLNCSCKHIYYNLSVYKDGQKKDIRTLKKLLGE